MSALHRKRLTLAAAAGLFLGAVPGCADRPSVLTHRAGLFSPAAVKEADQEAREIRRLYDKAVLVESFKRVSANPFEARRVEALNAEGRKQYFADWAGRRARETGRDVYVLICPEPAPVNVEVVARAVTLSAPGRDRLADLLRKDCQEGRYDDGLLGAVAVIREGLEENLGPPAPHVPFDWLAVVWIVLGILAVWGVFALIRRLRPPPGSMETGAADYGGGSLPAGLFATMARHELWDFRFRDLWHRPEPEAEPPPADGAPSVDPPDLPAPEADMPEQVHGQP